MRSQYDDIREHQGYRFGVRYVPDTDHGAPWEEADGHGVISEWTTRAKVPGERVLCTDRHLKRYYDVAATMTIAKRDGWDAEPFGPAGESNGARARRAVDADFEFLRQWCADQWSYVGVIVEQIDDDDRPTGVDASLWGVETYKNYHEQTVIQELIDECMASIEVDSPHVVLSEN